MEDSVPDEAVGPAVAVAPLRTGGSVTLPEGATDDDIDNALRAPQE